MKCTTRIAWALLGLISGCGGRTDLEVAAGDSFVGAGGELAVEQQGPAGSTTVSTGGEGGRSGGATGQGGASGGLTVVGPGKDWAAPPEDPASEATAYQIDAAHTGYQPRDNLRLPLTKRWFYDFRARNISYPLIANGRVFVTTVDDGLGNTLNALDEETGAPLWGPIQLGGVFGPAHATYERGRVFAVNFDGVVRAFDAATGTQIWGAQMPGGSQFSSPPTAFDRRVFVGGAGDGGALYAVAGADRSLSVSISVNASCSIAPPEGWPRARSRSPP